MSKRAQRWHLFGLYGFAVSAEDWASAPLFEDATLVPADFTKHNQDRATADWLVGSLPYRDRIDISQVPYGDLIAQPKPNSFIAIKRQHDPRRAEEIKLSAATRAREIAALLTVARSHYASQVEGFMDVTTLDRGPVCGVVKLPVVDVDSGAIESIDRVYAARWLREPDRATADEIRKALADGTILETPSKGRWRLHREDALVDLMIRLKRSPAEQRIARATVQLYAAHYGVGPDERLGQAITSLEMLFPGSTNFKLLESRLQCLLFVDDVSHFVIARLLKDRHGFVHDGVAVPEEAGNAALGLAAQAMFCMAEAVSKSTSLDKVLSRLDLLSAIRQNESLEVAAKTAILAQLGKIAPLTEERWIAVSRNR